MVIVCLQLHVIALVSRQLFINLEKLRLTDERITQYTNSSFQKLGSDKLETVCP